MLASGSVARRALLQAAGLVFTWQAAPIDEAAVKQAARAEDAAPEDAAMLLAGLKAAAVARSHRDAVVIGADQLLVCEGDWFDKPADMAEAARHLRRLRGRTHTLLSAVTCHRGGGEIWRHLARSRLRVRAFSEEWLGAYLGAEGEAVLSSVGAYRLEGPGMQLFDAVEGEHSAILGLPMPALLGFLRGHGVLLT